MYIHLLHKSNLFHQFFLLSFWFNIFLFKFHYFAVLLVICLQLILVFVVLEISNFVKLQLVYLFAFQLFLFAFWMLFQEVNKSTYLVLSFDFDWGGQYFFNLQFLNLSILSGNNAIFAAFLLIRIILKFFISNLVINFRDWLLFISF